MSCRPTPRLGTGSARAALAAGRRLTWPVTNANGVPDKFTVAITQTSSGLIQKLMAEHFSRNGSQLNSAALGAETISDDYARANTFGAFVVEDNGG